MNTCPLLCADGQTTANTCDSNALTYSCICASGNTPNISAYGQTLPSLECDNWVGQCVNASPNNAVGQAFCHSFACGSMNASAGQSSGAGAGPSTTGSAASSGPSATSSSATSSSSKAAATAIALGREYGTGAMLVGMAAIFGFAL